MKPTPVDLEQTLGLEPFFVIGIVIGETETLYSTYEYNIPNVPTIYPGVESFSNYSSLARTDGLGTVCSIKVKFQDYNGHFKQLYNTLSFYSNDIYAKIYISGGQVLTELFRGRFSDPIIYNVDRKTLELTVETPNFEDKIGYAVKLEDISSDDPNYAIWRDYSTFEHWPILIGNVKNYAINPLIQFDNMILTEEIKWTPDHIILEEDGSWGWVTTAYDMKLKGKLCNYLQVDSFYTVRIGNIYITGKVVATNHQPYSREATATLRFYNPGTNEEEGYFCESRYFENLAVTLVGEDTEYTVLELTDSYWLKGLDILLRYDTGFKLASKVVKQEGNKIYIPKKPFASIWTGEGSPAGPSLPYPVGIISAGAPFQYVDTFPENASISLVDHELHGVYVVDGKAGTTVQKLSILDAGKYRELPSDIYSVETVANLWQGTEHEECTIIRVTQKAYFDVLEPGFSTLYVDAQAEQTTLDQAAAFLLRKQVLASHVSNNQTYTGNCVINGGNSLKQTLTDLIWQSRNIITNNQNVYRIVSHQLKEVEEPIFTFTLQMIHNSDIIYSFTPYTDIKTRLTVQVRTNNHEEDEHSIIETNNVALYGQKDADREYYYYKDELEARDTIKWWVNRYSNPSGYVTFTSYINTIGLEILDRVSLDLGNLTFNKDTLPFAVIPPHGQDQRLIHTGIIVEIDASNVIEGLITYKVRLDEKMGAFQCIQAFDYGTDTETQQL